MALFRTWRHCTQLQATRCAGERSLLPRSWEGRFGNGFVHLGAPPDWRAGNGVQHATVSRSHSRDHCNPIRSKGAIASAVLTRSWLSSLGHNISDLDLRILVVPLGGNTFEGK